MRNIQKLRRLYKKTQDEMSDIAQYPKPLYAAFEQGRLELPERQIELLCEYFHVSREYLLGEGEE